MKFTKKAIISDTLPTKFQFLAFLFCLVISNSLYAQNPTIIPPPPITLECNGAGVDFNELQIWYEDYINPSNNNVIPDCNISSEITWMHTDVMGMIFDFSPCADFEIYLEFEDACNPGFPQAVPATITFADNEAPSFLGVIDPVTTVACDSPEASFWLESIISAENYQDECSLPHEITVIPDCWTCTPTCGSSTTVNVEATDHCGNSSQHTFTIHVDAAVVITDNDFDGFDDDVDNCPTVYNPGQEDIDIDGIGNACDTENEVGELTEIMSNLYLSAPYSGLILRSENGSCYIMIVNNDGSLSTLPVTCP